MKLTPEQIVQIDAALELAASVFGAPGTELKDLMDASRFLRLHCADKSSEEMGIVWLNAHFQVLDVETLGLGSVDYVEVAPRRIITSAVKVNAVHAIIFHNHPSGDCTPSNEDKNATMAWGQLLSMVGCELLDHLVIGREAYSIHKDHVVR